MNRPEADILPRLVGAGLDGVDPGDEIPHPAQNPPGQHVLRLKDHVVEPGQNLRGLIWHFPLVGCGKL